MVVGPLEYGLQAVRESAGLGPRSAPNGALEKWLAWSDRRGGTEVWVRIPTGTDLE